MRITPTQKGVAPLWGSLYLAKYVPAYLVYKVERNDIYLNVTTS